MGFFSWKKQSQDSICIQGFPGHVDTCKCLYLAAEKGIPIRLNLLDIPCGEHRTDDYLNQSPFGKIPCLSEGDWMIPGVAAILPYLDVKGGGLSLQPKKAAYIGEQNYWIEVGNYSVLPHINTLLEERVLSTMSDSGYSAKEDSINTAISSLNSVFDLADKHLQGRDYFTSSYSLTEIHWLPYLHFCHIMGYSDMLSGRTHLQQWFDRIRERKHSNSRAPYDVLPSLKQIQNKDYQYAAA